MTGRTLLHYTIVEKLGEGSMGVVWKARDTHLDRFVAVKVLPAEKLKDADRQRRFVQEAKAASALNHPNIVHIYDIAEADGTPFIAMEYVAGKTLDQTIGRKGLRLNEALKYAVQIADALAKAHSAGIIHRDLKPSNIMVTDEGVVKVLDFGLAKLTEPGSSKFGENATLATDGKPGTAEGTIVGTMAYMSPQQAEGKPVDARSDIFSFGSLIYEMITGQRAFHGDSKLSTLLAVLKEDPKPVSAVVADVPRDLEKIITRCLRKDPDRRWQTMADLKVALTELKEESDSGKLGTGPTTVLARRHNWVVIGPSVVALLLIVIALVAYTRKSKGPEQGGATRVMSLLVVPLENLSNDPAQEHFADGMTEELINRLGRIRALRVISLTSAMTYKSAKKPLSQIARELKIDSAVEGSVMHSGDRVRITVQLLDAKSEKHLWDDTYEGDLRDVLRLQSELASSIAREVQVKLTPQEKLRVASAHTVNPAAYEEYTNGRYHWNKRTPAVELKRSIEYFERAIKQDPSYAPAYAGLADAYALLGSIGTDDLLPPREAMPKAETAALKAVQLDDSLAEGHASLAYARMSYDWDWAGAEREFKRAMELNPGYATAHQWYAHYLLAMGQLDEALAEMERARDVDPLSLVINLGVGWCYYQARRYDRAIDEFRKTLEMNPGFALAHCTMGMAYEQKGLYKQAIEHYKSGISLSGGAIFASARLAHAYAKSGNRHEAQRMLDDLLGLSKQRYIPAVYVASIYEALGDDNHLMEWMKRAYLERSDYLIYLRTEPSLDRMRLDPRFIKVLQQIGLDR